MLKIKVSERFSSHWVVLIGVWLTVLFFEYLGIMQPVRKLGERLTWPAQQVAAKLTYQVTQPLLFIRYAYLEGESLFLLHQQLSQAEARITQLQAVEAENKALRELFRNTDRKWQETLVASPIIAYGSPAVAVGSSNQVKTGDAVLSQGTLIGRLGTVSEHQSEVLLLNSVALPFLLAKTEQGVTGVVRGTGQQIIFTEVTRSSQVTNGQLVMTLGQAGIPANIPLGTVRNMVSTDAEPVLTFQLNQATNFYEAAILEVVPTGQ